MIPLRRVVVGRGEIRLRRARHSELRRRPEHAPRDLVPHLHPIGHRARGLERFDRAPAVRLHLPLETGEVETAPRHGRLLVPRIRPRVRVMDVEQEEGARLLDPFRERDHSLERVVRRVPHRRHEHPQAERAPAMSAQDGQLVARRAVLLICRERTPPPRCRERRDVGAERERARGGTGGGACRARSRGTRREHGRDGERGDAAGEAAWSERTARRSRTSSVLKAFAHSSAPMVMKVRTTIDASRTTRRVRESLPSGCVFRDRSWKATIPS